MYSVHLSLSNVALVENIRTVFIFKQENGNLAVVVQVLQSTQNLVISRCCFAEDGKEMYKEL